MTGQATVDLILLARQIEHRYQLAGYEDEQLQTILASLEQTQAELLDILTRQKPLGAWTQARAQATLDYVEEYMTGVYSALGLSIQDLATYAGTDTADQYNDILSFGGRVAGFNSIELAPAIVQAAVTSTPVGGRLLSEWVQQAYDANVVQGVRQETLTGLIQGEGYPNLVKRLTNAFDMTKQEAVTLSRTYVQTISTDAALHVAQGNTDILKGWYWESVLENGFASTGRGICLQCAALAAAHILYPLNGGPEMPPHPRCRCVRRFQTKSWRDLGLDMDEIKQAYRPYTIRENKNIDAGGRREILEVGQHDGDYGTWFDKQSDRFKQDLLGPGRFALLKQNGLSLADMVDAKGNVKTLKELGA